MTHPRHKDTTLNQQCYNSKHSKGRTMQWGGDMTTQDARPIRTRDTPHTTPRHSTRGHRVNERCRRHSQEGDTNTQTGGSASQTPPFIYYATHHCNATPPSTMPPPTTTTRGERTKDTPPHKGVWTDSHPHYITHLATNSSMTRPQYSAAPHRDRWDVGRATRTEQTGTAHTTAIQHTTH